MMPTVARARLTDVQQWREVGKGRNNGKGVLENQIPSWDRNLRWGSTAGTTKCRITKKAVINCSFQPGGAYMKLVTCV